MRKERLAKLLADFSKARIVVIGDLFLDKWVFIDPALDEPSLETGLTAYQAAYTRVCPGAAGTVMNDLRALGVGTVSAVSLMGDDGDGFEVLRGLQQRGVDVSRVIKSPQLVTPTYLKPMFMKNGGAEEHNRIDFKNRSATAPELQKALIAALREAAKNADAVLALDQLTEENTGVITKAVRDELAAIARENPSLIVYADSRAFISLFKDMTVKCNNMEAERMALGLPEGEDRTFDWERVYQAMDIMTAQTGRSPFITCGAHGIAFRLEGKNASVPAARQHGAIDVCGAGDACSAGIVSALSVGANNREAAFLAMLAAGVTVRKLGETGDASPAEIMGLYDEQFNGAAE